ncbi:MAG: flagellar basal body L-ring protein FlgH [Candidatus Margulisiibacteriota bacterium]
MKKAFSLFLAVCLLSQGAFSTSLWIEGSSSPFVVQKPYKIGDVIMILIVESTSAAQKAGTDTQNQDSLGANFSHTIQKLQGVIGPSAGLQGSRSQSTQGSGSTTRSSNVLATVAVTVKNILPDGNLEIDGTHKVAVNEERQDIRISGIIRPKDISAWNTVYSYQVANADVSVRGTGAVAESSSPGIIMRFLNLLF